MAAAMVNCSCGAYDYFEGSEDAVERQTQSFKLAHEACDRFRMCKDFSVNPEDAQTERALVALESIAESLSTLNKLFKAANSLPPTGK